MTTSNHVKPPRKLSQSSGSDDSYYKKYYLPQIKSLNPTLTSLTDRPDLSKDSTAAGTLINVTDPSNIQILPELSLKTLGRSLSTKRLRSTQDTSLNSRRTSRPPVRDSQAKISNYLQYLHELPQNKVEAFEKKLKDAAKALEPKPEKKPRENGLGLDDFLPNDVKQIVLPNSPRGSRQTTPQVTFFSQRLSGPRKERGLSLKTTKLKSMIKIPELVIPPVPVNETKDNYWDCDVIDKAKDLADEVVAYYRTFQEQTAKHKDLHDKVKQFIKLEALIDVFNEKPPRRTTLEQRIYMDMVHNHGMMTTLTTKFLPKIPMTCKYDLSATSKASEMPRLIERRYHVYVRLRDELKELIFQGKIHNVDMLQKDLVNSYQQYTTKKIHLLQRLMKTDNKKLAEIYQNCDEFENEFPIYEPNYFLERLKKFETRKGDFESINPETITIGEKMNDLLKEWNECLENYHKY